MVARSRCQPHFHDSWCRWQPTWAVPLKIACVPPPSLIPAKAGIQSPIPVAGRVAMGTLTHFHPLNVAFTRPWWFSRKEWLVLFFREGVYSDLTFSDIYRHSFSQYGPFAEAVRVCATFSACVLSNPVYKNTRGSAKPLDLLSVCDHHFHVPRFFLNPTGRAAKGAIHGLATSRRFRYSG